MAPAFNNLLHNSIPFASFVGAGLYTPELENLLMDSITWEKVNSNLKRMERLTIWASPSVATISNTIYTFLWTTSL